MRESTTARGYGAAHQRARRRFILLPLKRHGFVTCVTCGARCTRPDQVDLGHDHTDPTGRTYRGPQCIPCNRGDGARRSNERIDRPTEMITRSW